LRAYQSARLQPVNMSKLLLTVCAFGLLFSSALAQEKSLEETRLGKPQLAKAAKRDTAAVRANARRFAANVLPIIEEIERAGVTGRNAIAAKLNDRNVRTARGGKWTHAQVGAVLRPFEASAAVG
jgi:Recombinase